MELTLLLNKLNKYKNTILNILVFVVALIISNAIYKNQNKVLDTMRLNNEKELKKNKILSNVQRLDKSFSDYKKAVNKKDISSVINNISNIAKESGVLIDSLKPLPEKVESVYASYPFELRMRSRGYHEVGRFMSKLESSPDIYIVDNMALSLDPDSQKNRIAINLKFKTILVSN